MVYYFSATGNSQYVAQQVADFVNEEIKSITECFSEKNFNLRASEKEGVGFVVPTYAWGLPEIVKRFFSKVYIEGDRPYIYFIATYGTTPGFIGRAAEKMLKARNITIDAYFDVLMPDNWTPTYDLSDPNKVAAINAKADTEIAVIKDKIAKCETGNFMKRRLPYFTSAIALREYEKMRRTEHFMVDDTCIGCGLCEKKCPDCAIVMRSGKPVWIKEQCIMCLGCLHRCPKFAIQYDDRTRNHGQYRHPNTNI